MTQTKDPHLLREKNAEKRSPFRRPLSVLFFCDEGMLGRIILILAPLVIVSLISGSLCLTHKIKVWFPKYDGNISQLVEFQTTALTIALGFVASVYFIFKVWPENIWQLIAIRISELSYDKIFPDNSDVNNCSQQVYEYEKDLYLTLSEKMLNHLNQFKERFHRLAGFCSYLVFIIGVLGLSSALAAYHSRFSFSIEIFRLSYILGFSCFGMIVPYCFTLLAPTVFEFWIEWVLQDGSMRKKSKKYFDAIKIESKKIDQKSQAWSMSKSPNKLTKNS